MEVGESRGTSDAPSRVPALVSASGPVGCRVLADFIGDGGIEYLSELSDREELLVDHGRVAVPATSPVDPALLDTVRVDGSLRRWFAWLAQRGETAAAFRVARRLEPDEQVLGVVLDRSWDMVRSGREELVVELLDRFMDDPRYAKCLALLTLRRTMVGGAVGGAMVVSATADPCGHAVAVGDRGGPVGRGRPRDNAIATYAHRYFRLLRQDDLQGAWRVVQGLRNYGRRTLSVDASAVAELQAAIHFGMVGSQSQSARHAVEALRVSTASGEYGDLVRGSAGNLLVCLQYGAMEPVGTIEHRPMSWGTPDADLVAEVISHIAAPLHSQGRGMTDLAQRQARSVMRQVPERAALGHLVEIMVAADLAWPVNDLATIEECARAFDRVGAPAEADLMRHRLRIAEDPRAVDVGLIGDTRQRTPLLDLKAACLVAERHWLAGRVDDARDGLGHALARGHHHGVYRDIHDVMRRHPRWSSLLREEYGGHGLPRWIPQAEATDRGTGRPLTPAEARALSCVAGGLTTREAAAHLGLSVHTVRTQLKTAHRRLGATTRAEAIERGRERGYL